jgi:hypothetical protein
MHIFRKYLVIGIIVLYLGAGFSPCANSIKFYNESLSEQPFNEPPEITSLICPDNVQVGKPCTIEVTVKDDNPFVTIKVFWDSYTGMWNQYYKPVGTHEFTHIYLHEITADLWVVAFDDEGGTSNRKECFITVPRNTLTTYPGHHWLLECFPLLERLLNFVLL